MRSNARHLIATMPAYEGDLQGVVNSWPPSQSEITKADGDHAKMNLATALVHANQEQQ
jgi:hypothetical protein